jgi:glycosyltransferase involved in cell wall biosynthesis
MGKPVVASGLGQIRDIIKDGETGLLCEPGDSDDLAEKIDLLRKNPELMKTTATLSREAITGRGDWKSNAARVLELVEEVWQRDQGRQTIPG